MPEEVPIFLSPEIGAVLAENGTDLVDLLRKEGYEVKVRISDDDRESNGQKDVVLILVASTAVIAAATPFLTRVLEALSNRPVIVTKKVPHETVAKGGKRRTKWVTQTEVHRPEKIKQKQETNISALGFKISFKSESS